MNIRNFLFIFSFFISISCLAQEFPPIAKYESNVYGAGNQNWMISQDTNQFLFFANNEGLLEFNGSAWTSVNSMNTGRNALTGFGIQTAAIAAGGDVSPGSSAATESYNGTSWTSITGVNTARNFAAAAGIQTAGIFFGGSTPSVTTATELWDGTGWSSAIPMTTARTYLAGCGNQTLALGAGGTTGAAPYASTATEEWTGTSSTGTASTLTTS